MTIIRFRLINSEGLGKRLVLKKIKEETDRVKIDSIRRRDTPTVCSENEEQEKLFLVYFDVIGEWPLIGATTKKNGE